MRMTFVFLCAGAYTWALVSIEMPVIASVLLSTIGAGLIGVGAMSLALEFWPFADDEV